MLRDVPVILPEGTEAMIRARFAAGALPDSFRLVRAEIGLRAATDDIQPADDGSADGVEPLEGIPERVTGVVLERPSDRILVVDVGFPLQLELPAGVAAHSFPLGKRVSAALPGDVEVVELSLL